MEVYTYSEARQKLSSVLDKAESTGKVSIRRKDGRTYALMSERPPRHHWMFLQSGQTLPRGKLSHSSQKFLTANYPDPVPVLLASRGTLFLPNRKTSLAQPVESPGMYRKPGEILYHPWL